MSDFYILDAAHNHIAVDCLTWALWFETAGAERVVEQTYVGGLYVSTVFLGVDHNFLGVGPAMLYETMIFLGNPGATWAEAGDQWRCATWAEAEAQHARTVGALQAMLATREAIHIESKDNED